jgi:hypothetical protein
MAKSDLDRITEEKIAKGGVLAKLYFDMQNSDKEKLQPLLVELVNEHLLKEKGVVYGYGMIEDPLEQNGLFITSAVVTVLCESFIPLVSISFNYSPAGIELIRPEKEMTFKMHELQGLLMDVSQISLSYSKYVLEHVLKPEDVAGIAKQIDYRSEVGKKLLEKKEDGK